MTMRLPNIYPRPARTPWSFAPQRLLQALVAGGIPVPELKVDGGAARSTLLCQFQADISGIPVVRPTELERTALGVATWRAWESVCGGRRTWRLAGPRTGSSNSQ